MEENVVPAPRPRANSAHSTRSARSNRSRSGRRHNPYSGANARRTIPATTRQHQTQPAPGQIYECDSNVKSVVFIGFFSMLTCLVVVFHSGEKPLFMIMGTGGVVANIVLILGVVQRKREMLVVWELYHGAVIVSCVFLATQFPEKSFGLFPMSTPMIVMFVIATVAVLACMLCVYNLICLIDDRTSHIYPENYHRNLSLVGADEEAAAAAAGGQIPTISGSMRGSDRHRRHRRGLLGFSYKESSLPSYYEVIKRQPSMMTMDPPTYNEAIRLSRENSPKK